MLGMVAIAPKVGRFSCHCWRRRLRGVGLAEVNCKTPFGWFNTGGSRALLTPVGPTGLRTGCLCAQIGPRNNALIADMNSRSRGAMRPSFASIVTLQKEQEGAGKAGCALHPRSRVHECTKKRTRAYRSSGGNPTFPAQWFTAYFVLSSVTGLSCHRRPQDISRELGASVGASGPHGFAVRVGSRSSLATLRVHCIPPRVRDDRDPPLSSGETRGFKSLICPTAKAEYFSQQGWTGF